jgi:predicted Zn-dependent peptidase
MILPVLRAARRTSIGIAAWLVATASTAHAEPLTLPHTKSVLPNGLTVILHEDRSLPMVVVDVMANVGSRHESKGRTGFAHLFEHLMFMGTKRVPTKAFDAWMEEAGGSNNATTGQDRTEYHDTGPSSTLPLLLWLEADRLRDLGTFMTKEKLDAQREVVRNERRQRSENQPYGKVDLRLPELLYPPTHPYHHPVIGSHEDLEAAQVGDVQEFFATWYDPSNLSIVVAGDFEPQAVRSEVTRLFGAIPSRGKPKQPPAPVPQMPELSSVVRETLTDRVELAKLIVAWHSPKSFAAGDADLDMVATILAGGKASRLYERLVRQKKLAQAVDASQDSADLSSVFSVEVLARPGASLDAIEAELDAELARIAKSGVTEEECTRARNGILFSRIRGLQSLLSRAVTLNSYERAFGDPNMLDRDLERYRKATPATVGQAARKWLLADKRVVLRVVPEGESGRAKAAKNAQGAQ